MLLVLCLVYCGGFVGLRYCGKLLVWVGCMTSCGFGVFVISFCVVLIVGGFCSLVWLRLGWVWILFAWGLCLAWFWGFGWCGSGC